MNFRPCRAELDAELQTCIARLLQLCSKLKLLYGCGPINSRMRWKKIRHAQKRKEGIILFPMYSPLVTHLKRLSDWLCCLYEATVNDSPKWMGLKLERTGGTQSKLCRTFRP
ncbi:hypothetical protein AVEN_228719-1 [Araneus ventricosus]|uniref:Uncharacterized protein n=1 Tax=Araneus ventricosus TaxID=182803 RepID=A0A4Y2M9K8_ARAVE|nr:hypothetical protein AVEN_228719-1 [Araneus ventricosus]